MIFRPQSVYIFFAFVVTLISGMFFVDNQKVMDFERDKLYLLILFALSLLMIFAAFFQYKFRRRQFITNRLTIILNIIILGYMGYQMFRDDKVYGYFQRITPFICVLLLIMANRHIKKDEDLVRSIDRIR